MIPPPNVTGSLTIGHVLNNTIQDVLIRRHRMAGDPTLWLPGMDHAGIATQNVVRRALDRQGIDYRAIGRDAFVEKVWEWRAQYGGTIVRQLRMLGCSCDWERERFTLDPSLSRAVTEVFVRLYEKGLIYRGQYLVNWCTGCRTVISDEEVEHEDVTGTLYYVRYPLAEGGGHVTVATTRPETMLGDTAVAVHPKDPRYTALVGKGVVLPILGRPMRIIADDYVDTTFGTGALKVTPGHDPNDFLLGERHGLPRVNILEPDGRLNGNAGPYAGRPAIEAREDIVRRLRAEGLIEKTEPLPHSVGHCHRCRTIIEPLLSTQWFVKMAPLAAPAIEAARAGRLRFYPERWEKVFLHWLENIRDWCISRQLWWGHRIPVWTCACGEIVVARSAPGRCPACGGTALVQDEDVLDTWFSSWLWPFSTFGWPDRTEDLARFYPSTVLVTGPDIIFFWVARMVMAGFEFMGGLPFRDVHLHGIVRDEIGRRMSKSLGNSPDPIAIMQSYGADALRFTMLHLTPLGGDVLFNEEKVDLGRNFANKIWNASRFVLMNLGADGPAAVRADRAPAGLETADRWILSRLERTREAATRAIDEYRMNDAAHELHAFFWRDLCDWYLEMAKPRLAAGAPDEAARAARRTLLEVLETALHLLHPLMPFVTEEIWSQVRGERPLLATSAWPAPRPEALDEAAEREIEDLQAVVVLLRNIRAEMGLPPSKVARAVIRAAEPARFEAGTAAIEFLARVELAGISPAAAKPRFAGSGIAAGAEVYMDLEGLIDVEAEGRRLSKEIERLSRLVETSKVRLGDGAFLAKAKEEVVARERARLAEMEETRGKLERHLEALRGS
jgi:valyl-tRNA synthetase